jgi:hypothetical protein
VYRSEDSSFQSEDLDEVINWARNDPFDRNGLVRFLKELIAGGSLENLNFLQERIIRWPDKNGGRGEHWYRLLRN